MAYVKCFYALTEVHFLSLISQGGIVQSVLFPLFIELLQMFRPLCDGCLVPRTRSWWSFGQWPANRGGLWVVPVDSDEWVGKVLLRCWGLVSLLPASQGKGGLLGSQGYVAGAIQISSQLLEMKERMGSKDGWVRNKRNIFLAFQRAAKLPIDKWEREDASQNWETWNIRPLSYCRNANYNCKETIFHLPY